MEINLIEQEEIIRRLDQIIRQASPNAVTVQKYGGTLYTLKPEEKEGQFCGVFPYKRHVQVAFSNGTALEDPKRVLSGTGKYRRHINFTSAREIDADVLVALIDNAAEYSQSLGLD